METRSHISLIDLGLQFPFVMDEDIKKEICFGETLVVSCGHYEGDIADDSDSEWTCSESSESEGMSTEMKEDKLFEVKDREEEQEEEEEESEEVDDFHFYFFPDCNKPEPVRDSNASLLVIDGLPKLNPAAKVPRICTCSVDKEGNCECHTKLPCKCGAKTAYECTCAKLDKICICDENNPAPVCLCGKSQVCTCSPTGKLQPVCTCHEIDKPCVCYPDKYPCPICTCKKKPTFPIVESKFSFKTGEDQSKTSIKMDEKSSTKMNEDPKCTVDESKSSFKMGEEMEALQYEDKIIPCICQKPDPPPARCLCLKGKECSCKEKSCICGVQSTCVCEATESLEEVPCKPAESKTVCACPVPQECTCGEDPDECKCFPKKLCVCGDPENCKCFISCDCTEPCICDTAVKRLAVCSCSEDDICTCPTKQKSNKLKRVRAGKHGYRWCHTVDPQHTFFDYGYGRHDKISYKEQEREKFKILGLYDEKPQEEVDEGYKPPIYKKTVRKPSIDCCSAVGGISISVETLGEDQDKFLVQVVSHLSKEGANTGSKLVSILDCNLHTMEENRTEHVTKKNITKERRSYMAICENGYYNKVTRICGERHVVKRLYHTFDIARNFLLEGANVVLLRYFGLRRYRGVIKTQTVLMNGTICESVYVCHGVSQAIVNGKPLCVCKVERHIIEPSGYIHQTLTVLTLRGYIVSHEWADNHYVLHLNPLLTVIPEKDEIEPHAPLRERWRNDLQLLSDYLDFKSTRSSDGGRYVTENGALTGTVRDYLQALLLLKPQDALHFTRHYFSSALSAMDLPYDEYFDSATKHVRYYFFED